MPKKNASIVGLAWGDLESWAGSKIVARGRSYKKNVRELCRTEAGGLVAWVQGTEQYATHAWMDEGGNLRCACSCPYDWGPCKHAVAVILTYLDAVKNKSDVPGTKENDRRLLLLATDLDRDGEVDAASSSADLERVIDQRQEVIRRHLAKMSKNELIEFILAVDDNHPRVGDELIDRENLAGGNVERLIESVRNEIEELTPEPAWNDHWSDRVSLPDYSRVGKRMNDLLQAGQADALLLLGQELIERGTQQIECSHEGETAWALEECLEIVFKAVPKSSLSSPDQLLWMLDAFFDDEYGLLESIEAPFQDKRYKKDDWSRVADVLLERLEAAPVPDNDDSRSGRYHRERLMRRAIDALERSGRKKEIVPLLEREAPITGCYEKLVDALISTHKTAAARSWAARGFKETLERFSGIAWQLVKRLREIEERGKNVPAVAAYRALEFFYRPELQAFEAVKNAAEKADLWEPVRERLLHYLETGERPDLPAPKRQTRKGKRKVVASEPRFSSADWPLPAIDAYLPKKEHRWQTLPDTGPLIDIAIFEKRLEDVVKWYEESRQRGQVGSRADSVADAVQKSHPDLSLGIWRRQAESLIAQVKPAAYQEAAHYLKKMKTVHIRTKRQNEYDAYIDSLRIRHKAKRRLMQVLDSIEGKRIIES